MNSSLRFLMGVALMFILVPTLAMTMPGGIADLNLWASTEPIGSRAGPTAVASGDVTPGIGGISDRLGASDPFSPGPESESQVGAADRETTSTIASQESTTSDAEAGSAEDGSKTSSDGLPASTTQPPTESTGNGSDARGSGTITGDACPCTVTGIVELKGNISLQGDLMVMGGTLVARPGVNVEGNGHQIMFMDGGTADFQGTEVFTWSGNGSNANLTRDITFSNLRRIMFHNGAGPSILKYFIVANSGTGALGDYSLHWHLNGDSARGTIVQGVVVINSANHAFVPHGSHGITFKDTIAKNGRCDAYWWDPPEFQSTSTVNNSNDIVYDHALADGVTNCIGDSRGFRLSAFNLGAGRGNIIRNSVARNVKPSSPKDCSGFHWPELHHDQPSSWTFTNNASFNSLCNGIFVWQNDSQTHTINGFKGDGIDHGAYVNTYDYRNINVDFVEVHALSWSVTGGSIGVVKVFRHALRADPVVFSDVTIDRFIINNADDGGHVPGTYVLSNTGLACADIEYVSVVPGTVVRIDGIDC